MEILLHSLILLCLFTVSGCFSAAETALFSLSKIEKRRLVERHPQLVKWILHLLDRPRRTLISILIGNLLVNTLSAVIVTLLAIHYFGPKGVGILMVLYTMVLIIFCEIFPKVMAVRYNERLSLVFSFPLQIFAVLVYPIRILTRIVTDWLLSFIIRERKEHPDMISEDELKTLVKIGEEEGVLDRQERYMIQKLFDLGERPVKSIMTPRIDMIGLDIQDPTATHVETMKRYHFSQLPVFEESMDHILGVISVQEYMLSPEHPLRQRVHQPLFVPNTKRIDDLLEEFRKKSQSIAICVDEFGGTAGIVTLEDILEEIFGEYYDEYAKVENPVRPIGHGEFIVEAKVSLQQFNEIFATNLKAEEAATLGGYILEKLGEVPEKGKTLEADELVIRIHDVIRQRIRSVTVRRKT
ncbi:MAG TPA: hemolysin family protein [bacterium]|nr:hemolysin family protein [bacterium]